MGDQYRLPPATFDESIYQYLAHQIQERFVMVTLLGSLYGVLAVLTLLSFYALVQGGTRKQPATIVLCLALLGLFASTTVHMVTNILFHLSSVLFTILTSESSLWTYGGLSQQAPYPAELVNNYSQMQSCATTAVLTINMTLGDAIVCWRACVIWHKHRAVIAGCSVLVSATFALGVVATALSCNSGTTLESQCATMFLTGVMYERLPAGIAACALSLVTNIAAMLLVGYKAWESRKRLRGYLIAGPRAAQVEKLFVLLIESGAVYCALWVVIVAFQISEYKPPGPLSSPDINSFLDIFGVVVNGALVPAIAIYPAVIVVLVALDRSHIEKAFMENDRGALDAFQLDPIPIGAATATGSKPPENGLGRRQEALLIDDQVFGDSDRDESSEDTGTQASEQLDLGGIV